MKAFNPSYQVVKVFLSSKMELHGTFFDLVWAKKSMALDTVSRTP